jgi:hypothetical protein
MHAPLPYRDQAQNDKRNQAGKFQCLDDFVQSSSPIAGLPPRPSAEPP